MSATAVVMATTGMMVMAGVVVMMVVVMSRPRFCVGSNQAERCRHSQDSTRHRYSFVWGRSRQCDPRRRKMEWQFMPERRGLNARNFLIRCVAFKSNAVAEMRHCTNQKGQIN
jgi:hypothetical protein